MIIVTPIPSHPWVNSVTSGDGGYGWIVDAILWVAGKLFEILSPFINWGSQILIVACVLIYICSREKKYLASSLKWGIVYIVFWVIKGAGR
jgi:hypothetical protein